MEDLTLWQLVIDGALVAALIFLATRVVSQSGVNSQLAKVRRLDESLRALVREAQASSSTLNEELSSRQRSLEQLLFDLQSVESRVNRAIDTAERLRLELQSSSSAPQYAAPQAQPAVCGLA